MVGGEIQREYPFLKFSGFITGCHFRLEYTLWLFWQEKSLTVFLSNFWNGTTRLKERLGCEPSDDQLATALRIPRAELQSKLIECTLAREKLAMGNIRLVMSIAQRYENMGAEMADLVQVIICFCMISNIRYQWIHKLNYCWQCGFLLE